MAQNRFPAAAGEIVNGRIAWYYQDVADLGKFDGRPLRSRASYLSGCRDLSFAA
jgi:hypothetical protein